MRINIVNINNLITEFEKLVSDFEANDIGIFKNINEISKYWQDNDSNEYFIKIELDSKNQYKLNLNEILELFKKIYNKYNDLGYNVEIVDENNEKIIERINSLKEDVKGITSKFNELQFASLKIKEYISKQIQKNSIHLEKLNIIKDNVSTILDTIEKNEEEVRQEISKISTIKIPEFNHLEYIDNQTIKIDDNTQLDLIGMENSIQKLVSKINTQLEIINKIKIVQQNLLENYKTNNTLNIEDIVENNNGNLKIIEENYNKYITVLNYKLSQYNYLFESVSEQALEANIQMKKIDI